VYKRLRWVGESRYVVFFLVHRFAMRNLFIFGAFATIAAAASGGVVEIRQNGDPTTKPIVDAVRNGGSSTEVVLIINRRR
jgi:hypothetical protein